MRLLFDIEADSLDPTKIWCFVGKDIDTGKHYIFKPSEGNYDKGHLDWKNQFVQWFNNTHFDEFIGHNIVSYDVPVCEKLLGISFPFEKLTDTLVLSRLFRPVTPFDYKVKNKYKDSRVGGHSLGAWGVRLGSKKIGFEDFSKYTQEMLRYCVGDVELNHKVYDVLMQEKIGFSETSIRLEHRVSQILDNQKRAGFQLDIEAAKHLERITTIIRDEMFDQLQDLFPPAKVLIRENYAFKYKETGEPHKRCVTMLEKYQTTPDLTAEKVEKDLYNFYQYVPFNPQSPPQIAARLLELGWNPRKFTPTGNPSTKKEDLEDSLEELVLLHPDKQELMVLVKYRMVTNRLDKAITWQKLADENGRVHGSVNPIGAGTHRCSHFDDNMANITKVNVKEYKQKNGGFEAFEQKYRIKPKYVAQTYNTFDKINDEFVFISYDKDKEIVVAPLGMDGAFGWECRSSWITSDPDNVIVGADAAGIQLRALAHYMNDPEYIKAVTEGDVHVVNQKAAGLPTRPVAKTFIYAWLLGAGDEKIGIICGVTEAEYAELITYAQKERKYKSSLLDSIMYALRKNGRKADKHTVCTIIKGYRTKKQFLERTPALRHLKEVEIPKTTEQGYLVGIDGRKLWIPNQHLAMSLYLQGFEAVIMKAAMCFYHQELEKQNVPFQQVAFVHDEFQIETPRKYAHQVGQAVSNSLQKAGEFFNSNCPLGGEYHIGRSWAETH